MRYLLAILLPPAAVAISAGVMTFVLNVFLWLLFWIPGSIHAILVVNKFYADRRHDEAMFMQERAIAAQSGIELINPRTARVVGWIVTPLALIGLLFVALLAWGIWHAQS